MKQLIRRIVYLLAGAAPATYLLVDFPSSQTNWFSAASWLGTAGLYVAAVATFPAKRWVYWAITLLLVLGLCAMAPWTIILTYASVTNIAQGRQIDLAGLPLIAWLFIGPVAVAGHFFAKARCAPNNSFKPNPLRGSA